MQLIKCKCLHAAAYLELNTLTLKRLFSRNEFGRKSLHYGQWLSIFVVFIGVMISQRQSGTWLSM